MLAHGDPEEMIGVALTLGSLWAASVQQTWSAVQSGEPRKTPMPRAKIIVSTSQQEKGHCLG